MVTFFNFYSIKETRGTAIFQLLDNKALRRTRYEPVTITQVMNTKEDTIIEQSITALKNKFPNGIEFYQKRTLIPLKLCFMYCQTIESLCQKSHSQRIYVEFLISQQIYISSPTQTLPLSHLHFQQDQHLFPHLSNQTPFFFFQALTVSSEYVHFLASKPMKAIFFFSRLDVCFLKRTLTLVSFFLLERLFS